jgi:predicted nuclease with RNAse H fold
VWAGVDVGGARKGFHVALLGEDLRIRVERAGGVERCVELVAGASLVAVDAPSAWADDGEGSRSCERAFARAGVCGIRFTPDEATAGRRTDRYYEWVEQGLLLWSALRAAGVRTVEGFPTASWTAWLGRRSGRSRTAWTRDGVGLLAGRIGGLEAVRDQDQRDAVAAALTARQWDRDPASVEDFGGLVVPRAGTLDVAIG